MNIPRAVRTCRLARRLSQQELAARANINPSYLSLIEAGRKEPSLPMLRNLADALQLSVDALFLTAIDYDRLRSEEGDLQELLGQMLAALVTE